MSDSISIAPKYERVKSFVIASHLGGFMIDETYGF